MSGITYFRAHEAIFFVDRSGKCFFPGGRLLPVSRDQDYGAVRGIFEGWIRLLISNTEPRQGMTLHNMLMF